MLLLITDANILIDAENGNYTSSLFRLPYEFAVPDVLFELELKELHSHLLEAGLKIKNISPEFVEKAESLVVRYPKPSTLDHLALALALQEKCSLLTGDKDLRVAAIAEGVEVHGSVWIIKKMLEYKILEKTSATQSFENLKLKGSRLPWKEVEILLCSYD